jgi:tetratricopeptide (TPR) repeat protein
MRKLSLTLLLAGGLCLAGPLWGQEVCPGFSIVMNTPEDELTLAYNGAENPQEQIAALDKFVQEQPDSKFLPCAHEYYTMAYMKLSNYDKVIEYGEKGLAEHQDVMLMMNLTKAYVAGGKVSDTALETVLKAAEQIKTESTPSRPTTVGDEEWQKILEEAAVQAKDWRAYMEYAFFQFLQREPDGNKRAQWLDRFVQAYPESPNTAQINFNHFLAYKLANNPAKLDEYGEKAVAADPDNVGTLNLVADDYVTRQTNLDKAETYAKKALDLAPAMKKPEGLTDEQFKAAQNSQLGFAHLTLASIAFQRGIKTKKIGPAIQEFKVAIDLLSPNPELQSRALFYLGWAYEAGTPANHKGAIEALTRAVSLATSWQAQAQDLLAKVKKAVGQ